MLCARVSICSSMSGRRPFDEMAGQILVESGRTLGASVWVWDGVGVAFSSFESPPFMLMEQPSGSAYIDGPRGRYLISPLHEGTTLVGHAASGPISDVVSERAARHLIELAKYFVLSGRRHQEEARAQRRSLDETRRELEEKNERLAEAVARLEEADRVKANFLATVSHELRTPLTSVIGYSEMLLEGIAGELNEEQRDYVRTVMEKGDQLLQLISGLLDISRIEAGELHLLMRPFDLGEVVSVALSTIAPQARRGKLSLTCHVQEGLPLILGDRDKIRQVVINLLGNAVKFTSQGGEVTVSVAIAPLEQSGNGPPSIRLSVRDTGIGIAPENHHRVFDPFYQVDNSSTRVYGGTGLGLSIVKRFIDAHGGRLWLRSELGKGSTFFFTLPLSSASRG